MNRACAGIVGLMVVSCVGMARADEAAAPRVKIETSKGDVVVELNREKAPTTVDNFLRYVNDGFYDGTIFHRVIADFMIQGGGFTTEMVRKKTREPITNEADNGLRNRRGTIAMARRSDPHSATCQFFINTVDNAPLNHRGKTPRGWGYCVFGKVVEGMNTVDAIRNVETTTKDMFRNVPVETVVIEKVSVVEEEPEGE